MLRNLCKYDEKPSRVVILGASGFIGQELVNNLKAEGIDHLGVTSSTINLMDHESSEQLAQLLHEDDCVVFLSALTPDKGKGIDAFDKNIRMSLNVYRALEKKSVSHLVYISSDAIYSMSENIISECTTANPVDLYGLMHFTRERMFKTTFDNLLIFRPTLVYGVNDTHNSYGPNRLRRMAKESGEMILFGEGEETRDHILVHDLSRLLMKAILHKTVGELNVATGHSVSYMELAHLINKDLGGEIKIKTTERQNPITHRHFDVSNVFKVFPDYRFTSLVDGIALVNRQAEKN